MSNGKIFFYHHVNTRERNDEQSVNTLGSTVQIGGPEEHSSEDRVNAGGHN